MLKAGEEPVPGYRLEAFLGRGKFGEVWRARTPGGAKAALKFLDLSAQSGWKEFRAIQRVKAIRHANLMPITSLWVLDTEGNVLDDSVIDSFAANDNTESLQASYRESDERDTVDSPAAGDTVPRQLIVATLLGDRNLLELLRQYQERGESGIPADELLDFMDQAAKGIDYLNHRKHDLGSGPVSIQHCDIKPDNIMVVGDSILVCDFGLARVLGDGRSAVTATNMVGSVAYMSPECAARKPSRGSDQYSLAVSYVELRTGRLPFASETMADVMLAIQTNRLHLDDLSPAEQKVIRRATSADPDDRYPTASAMVDDLRRAVRGEPAHTGHRPSRSLLPIFLATVAGAGVVAAVLLATRPTPPPPIPRNGDTTPPPQTGDANDRAENQQETPIQTFSYTVQTEPASAGVTVTIDGQSHVTDADGTVLFSHDEQQPVTIQIAGDDDYEPFSTQLVMAADHRIVARRQRTPTRLVRDADELIAAGSISDARELLAQAFDKAPELASPLVGNKLLDIGATLSTSDISPNRRSLVVTTNQGRLVVCDLQEPQREHVVFELAGMPEQIALGNDVAMVSYFPDRGTPNPNAPHAEVAVIRSYADSATSRRGEIEVPAELAPPLAITGDEQFAAIGVRHDGQNRLMVLSLTTESSQRRRMLPGETGMISRVLVDPSGTWAVTFDFDELVQLWELTGDSAPKTLASNACSALVYLPARHAFAFGIESDDTTGTFYQLVIHPLRNEPAVRLTGHTDDEFSRLVTDSDNRWLVACSASGDILGWDLHETDTTPVQLPREISASDPIVVLPNGQLVTTSQLDRTMELWDLRANDLNTTIRLQRPSAATTGRLLNIEMLDATTMIATFSDGISVTWDLDRATLYREVLETLPKRLN